jgi:hypothetical protein
MAAFRNGGSLKWRQFGEHFENEIDLKLTNYIVRNGDHLENLKGELNWRREQLVGF